MNKKISRRKSLKFHIASGDYFGTLATVLYMLRQMLEKPIGKIEPEVTLKNLTEDLLFLQRHYEIKEK